MPARKIFIALVIILVAIGGFVAGLYLLGERQEIREEASVPGGQATVSISPEEETYNIGDVITSTISFNTSNIAISGVAVRLIYPYTGTTPEVVVEEIEVNQSLLSTGDWTCPTQTSAQQGGDIIIDIACANTSSQGFSTSTNVTLATLTLRAQRQPTVNPVVLRFDSALSVARRTSDNQDVLLIPSSTGSYTIGDIVVPTETQAPTPTTTTTLSPSPTLAVTATPTATVVPGITVSPTPTPVELPDAGVSYPTMMGVGLGILMIIGAIVLAL